MIRKNAIAALLAVTALLVSGVDSALAGGDWNDKAVQWRSYDEGIGEAKKAGKPILLIFYTDWCPHCTKYSAVFHDDAVIAKSKNFVMVRVNKDDNAELSGKYAPDGQYIPRTFFLKSDASLMGVKTPRDKYQYFYNPQGPAELLAAMDKALASK